MKFPVRVEQQRSVTKSASEGARDIDRCLGEGVSEPTRRAARASRSQEQVKFRALQP
jgi:hypothetical protein